MEKNLIVLGDDLLARCDDYASRVVESYRRARAGGGTSARLRSLSLAIRDAEYDVELQSLARAAECAFCVWGKLDPLEALDWQSEFADAGADALWRGLRIDVKHTNWSYRYLIWPLPKTALFDKKPFDVMVFVKASRPRFLVSKWITKREFRTRRLIAGAGHKLLEGTRYMDQDDLHPINTLIEHTRSGLALASKSEHQP